MPWSARSTPLLPTSTGSAPTWREPLRLSPAAPCIATTRLEPGGPRSRRPFRKLPRPADTASSSATLMS
eukprot:10603671-Alexandrium_andersonii.AAC.1